MQKKGGKIFGNLFQEGKEYGLLLEDGQSAMFLPGSNQEPCRIGRA